MTYTMFKDTTEIATTRYADCPLGRQADRKVFDKSIKEYDKPLYTEVEKPESKSGRYGDIFKQGEGDKIEVHHMPADSTTRLEHDDGPAIRMDKGDHRQTASCGSSREAREYRAAQKELIEQRKFRDALQMDVDDIHEKFGDKYDEAIAQMLDYVDQLESEGKIDG